MKHKRRHDSKPLEPDMTPMIDMTFMLIAFFMVLINFSEADQNQAVRVPSSELAKPPEGPIESPLFLHVTSYDSDQQYVYFAGNLCSLTELENALYKEKLIIDDDPERSVGTTNVIIRGDRYAKTEAVQKVIALCQKPQLAFERFMFRAKWEKEQ